MLDPTPTVLFCHIVSCSKSVSFGCEQGRRWVRRRQEAWPNSRWATRNIDRGQIQRITWCLSPQRRGPDRKTGESLFILLPISWKSLGTHTASPNFFMLIQHSGQFSPMDGCAFGCKPLYGLLRFNLSHDVVVVIPQRGRHGHRVYWKPFLQLCTHN